MDVGLTIIRKLKQSRIGIGPWKVATPHGLIAIGVAAMVLSFLLAAILKWIGLAIAVIGLALLFWPIDQKSE